MNWQGGAPSPESMPWRRRTAHRRKAGARACSGCVVLPICHQEIKAL